MDDIVARSRKTRYRTLAKKKRVVGLKNLTFAEKLAGQVVITLIVLLFAWFIKSVNIPVTRYLSSKTSDMLSYNIEIKNVYDAIDKAIGKIFGKEETSDLEDTVATNGSMYEFEVYDTDDIKGYYFIIPVDGKINSPFGERTDPITGKTEIHKGIDLTANLGDPIVASMDGEVVIAEAHNSYGNYIKLKHDGGFETLYAHCSELIVKKGQIVYQGDIIAKAGNTGESLGPHLHFEIIKDGNSVNPQDFLLFE